MQISVNYISRVFLTRGGVSGLTGPCHRIASKKKTLKRQEIEEKRKGGERERNGERAATGLRLRPRSTGK